MATSSKSIQGRKQRKFRYNAPNHARRRMVAVHIGKELRAKLGTARRSIQAHKGDKVKILRGDHKGHTGKIFEVDLANLKVYVEGATARTAKGVEKLAQLDPSNLVLLDGEFVKDRLSAVNRSPKKATAAKMSPSGDKSPAGQAKKAN
jgi:large subunit ribosomal protein L24